MKVEQGQSYKHELSYTQEQVNEFIKISGDNNPIHYSEEYASNTRFKKPIIHGFLSASIFSRIFGTMFPGEGTIYLSLNLNFLKPMYVNTKYIATVEIKEIWSEKHQCSVITKIEDEAGVETVSGESIIYHKERI